MTRTPSTLGASIRARRAHRRMTLDDLADACGVTRTTVWRWEVGDVDVPYHQLVRVADALRTSVAALVTPRRAA